MNLEEYCNLLKHYRTVIETNLAPFDRYNVEGCNQWGPGSSYEYVRLLKKNGNHNNKIIINNTFTNIYSELGGFQLCTSSSLSRAEFQAYNNARIKIISELGLVRKKREIYNYNGITPLYEYYYEISNIPYPHIHTYKEIKKMWKSIN
mgnify:CR=1 FL=1